MSLTLVPRPAARRAPARRSSFSPLVALGVAAGITLALGSAVASLVPEPAVARESAPVFGPVRLAAVQVVASR